ncbi:MAG: protein kinase [FCB group bacterium]|nr:protein kinase [FCB group bacterium]
MSPNNHDDDKTQTHVVLTSGTEVAHYRIVEKIGAGGMGEVYLAEDTKLNRKVALKFLPQHLCQDKDCRTRFTREAQAAAKLDHPNIAGIYEVGEYQGRPYYAMQLIEGQSLGEVIVGKDLPIERILEIGIQICEGLHAAHDKGIIHRDIKPSNVLIDSHGRVRIVDFGLAAVAGTDQLTKTGSTLGTIGYMSPEQVRGEEVDHRSDLFSLGVVLYELITKQNPFRRDNEAATLKAVSDDLPEPLARFKSGLPDGLQGIIEKVLEKDVKTRYQHADGLLSDLVRLKRLLESGQTTVSIVSQASRPGRFWWIVGALAITAVIVVIVLSRQWSIDSTSGKAERIMLAVLPFENLGDPDDEYFADGMTDEITSRLAVVHGLGVISRTSAYTYKNSDKTLPEIAKELGVDYILEGTIRWDKSGEIDRVRITPQLIRVADDLHLWAANFEKGITKIFEVQIDIATQIVDTLGVTLLANERRSLQYKPTDNFDAYDLYLQGKEYWDRGQSVQLAIQLLERAVEADSGFVKAHSLLARFYGYVYFNVDRTDQHANLCEEAAKNAVRFSDGGIEGNIAMGYYYYYAKKDYDRALKEFKKVLSQQPNNGDVLEAIGYVQRRQGYWRESADNLKKALEINPHSRALMISVATSLQTMREYEELERILDKSLSLTPDAANLLIFKAYNILRLSGDTLKVRAILDEAARHGEPDIMVLWQETFDVFFRDYKSAVSRRAVTGDYILTDSAAFYLNRAEAYYYWGNDSISEIYYDSARMVVEQWLINDPEEAFSRLLLGAAYAGLGRSSEAIREGRKAVELIPITEDALYGAGMLGGLTQIYVMVGEYDLAIDELEYLMSIPSGIGLYDLRHHPQWDSLRDHPRFQALLEKYDTRD